jgi:hypothetical protein
MKTGSKLIWTASDKIFNTFSQFNTKQIEVNKKVNIFIHQQQQRLINKTFQISIGNQLGLLLLK